jgi:hypothetical protein
MSSPLRITIPTVLALSAGALVAAFGCGGIGVTSDSAFAGPYSDGLPPDPGEDGGGTPKYLTDAGAAADAANTGFLSNPLCLHRTGTCDPDLSNVPTATNPTTATEQCGGEQSDAAPDAKVEYACHVTKTANGAVAPTCTASGASAGACGTSAICKAGFECIGAQAGECRRYCCDSAACDPATFCDVQAIVSTDVIVPVCMPIVNCELLSAASPCRDTQQCGIVDQTKGTTSCIDVGPRKEGEECETDHCDRGLVCLGTTGSRKCFQLCQTNDTSSCTMGQRCLTNSVVFKGADVGICGQ